MWSRMVWGMCRIRVVQIKPMFIVTRHIVDGMTRGSTVTNLEREVTRGIAWGIYWRRCIAM